MNFRLVARTSRASPVRNGVGGGIDRGKGRASLAQGGIMKQHVLAECVITQTHDAAQIDQQADQVLFPVRKGELGRLGRRHASGAQHRFDVQHPGAPSFVQGDQRIVAGEGDLARRDADGRGLRKRAFDMADERRPERSRQSPTGISQSNAGPGGSLAVGFREDREIGAGGIVERLAPGEISFPDRGEIRGEPVGQVGLTVLQQPFEFGERHQSAIPLCDRTGDNRRLVALERMKNLNPRRVSP